MLPAWRNAGALCHGKHNGEVKPRAGESNQPEERRMAGLMNGEGDEIKPGYGIATLEKRKYPRYSVGLPIEYYPGDAVRPSSGHTGNVNEGGILVYFPKKGEIGEQFRFKFFFPLGTKLRSIEPRGEVVWVGTPAEGKWGNYPCGVKFVNISAEDRSRLKAFLKTLLP